MSATAVARGVIALVAFGFLVAQPAFANDAAHKMAEKFAGPSKGTSKEPASTKAVKSSSESGIVRGRCHSSASPAGFRTQCPLARQKRKIPSADVSMFTRALADA